MDRRPELQRRTMTLWEQMSTSDPAIHDFLKVPHDDGSGGADRRPCTLMDAICRDSRGDSMINWKPLRDRLRLSRAARASSTASTTTRNHRPDQEDSHVERKDEAPATGSMSLMAMLEQADNQWDDDGDEEEDSGASASNSGAVVGEEEDDGEGRGEEEMLRACCVCMVRHKGAAFIPCGHTFCRLCSRDLWHTGASCPLCNAFIHDILHIF